MRRRPCDRRRSTGTKMWQHVLPGTRGLAGDQSDYKVDMFAVGVVLYFMVRGRGPFQCNDPKITMTLSLSSDPFSLIRRTPEIVSPPLKLQISSVQMLEAQMISVSARISERNLMTDQILLKRLRHTDPPRREATSDDVSSMMLAHARESA